MKMIRPEFIQNPDEAPEEEKEKFELIQKKDAVSDKEREAFIEMLRRNELDESEVIGDPILIEKIINTLPERQKEVVRRKYFNHERFEDIGQSLGVTKSRAQQIFSDALKHLESKGLEEHPGHSEAAISQAQILKDLIDEYNYRDEEFKWGNPGHETILSNILKFITDHDKAISELDPKVFKEVYRETKRMLKNIRKKSNYNDLIAIRKKIIQVVEADEK